MAKLHFSIGIAPRGSCEETHRVELQADIPDKYGTLIEEGSKIYLVLKDGIKNIAKELNKDAGN